MNSYKYLMYSALAATLVAAGCVNRAAQQQGKITEAIITNPVQPVVVTPVRDTTLAQTIEITGDLTTSNDVNVGAKNSGRLIAVYVQDGTAVRSGQVIAQQDTSNQQITLQQDLAQETSAQSALAQAIANEQIGPEKSMAAVQQAKAQLAQAQVALQKALNGARPEEKAEADATVASAKSTMDTAKKQRDRQRQLLDQGAISQQDFDTAENQFETAESAYQSSVAAQQISRSQTRPEDIQSARDQVAQSQQALLSAEDQKKLDSLFHDQVVSARASLQNAIATVRMAEQAIHDAQIRAPFDGVVYGKPAELGTVLSAGGTVAHLVGKTGTYFEGNVSENDIANVTPGEGVLVSVDSLPNRTFPGHIESISPSASTVGRLFTVRVRIDTYSSDLKPGMFARGVVSEKSIRNAILVPTAAIVQQNGADVVFVVKDGKAHVMHVTAGAEQGTNTQVHGLTPGQEVVTTGQNNLVEGTKVQVDAAQASNSGRGI